MTADRRRVARVLLYLADQRRTRTDSHGIINFSLGLAAALPNALEADEALTIVVNDELEPELDRCHLRPGDEVVVVAAPNTVIQRLWLDHVHIRALERRAGATVTVHPKGFLPLLPSRSPRPVRAVCLHDDIPIQQLRSSATPARRRLRAAYFSTLLRRSVRHADVRMYVSEFTAERLRRLAGRRPAVDAVVSEGLNIPRVPLVALAHRTPTALLLGSPHPHKRTDEGVDLVLGSEALRFHVDEVVVVGWPGHRRPRPGEPAFRHISGPLPTDELVALLATCRLFVFPSTYEGFGLPPLEALALGTPVVYARSPVTGETLGTTPGAYDADEPWTFEVAAVAALALGDDDLGALAADVRQRFEWASVARAVAIALRAGTPR